MILECQQHPDYKRAVQTILDLAEEYGRHGRSMAKDGSGTVKDARTNFQKAADDLKVWFLCHNSKYLLSNVANTKLVGYPRALRQWYLHRSLVAPDRAPRQRGS